MQPSRLILPLVLLAPLGLGGCMAASASADTPRDTPVWLGQVAVDGQTHAVRLSSWKARRFDGLVRQESDFSCGAAALATVFNHAFGKSVTERQLLINMFKVADPDVVREKGFSLLDMKNYVTAIGMRADGYKVGYDALGALKVPGIALINLRGYKHFVVVRRAGPTHIQLGDPALGNKVMSRPAFEAAWNGVIFVVTGEGYDPANSLLNPPPPLTARALFEQRSPTRDAEVYDFGLGPAFNFVL